MEIQPDFKELLELLNGQNAEYLIVGSYALAHYGAPRYTGDIDIFINKTKENALKIKSVLDKFGFASLNLSQEDFCQDNQIIQLGVPPVRVDLITSISGVDWDTAWSGKEKGEYGGVPVHYLGKKEFIANKKASGRHKDLADIEALGETDS